MHAILLTIHTLIVIALVGVVLLQRSEGGALGMGGGGGGGLMSGRGAANALTRSTTILGALFFTTSLVLAITSDRGITELEILEQITGEETPSGDGLNPDDFDPSAILDAAPNVPTTAPEVEAGASDGDEEPAVGIDDPQ